MAVEPSAKGALLYAAESSWAEVSTIYGTRLPIAGDVNAILAGCMQPKDPAQITTQYNNEGRRDALMPQTCEFDVPLWLAGHGSSCASGAIGATSVPTFLGLCLGGSNAGQTGGTVNAGTSAVQFSLTDAVGVAGGLFRLGALPDGAGGGEWYCWNNPSTATILNAAAGTPSAGAVVYGAETVHANETSSQMSSMRFNALTASQRVGIWGAVCTGVTIEGTNVGELPKIIPKFTASAWDEESASTWPCVTAVDNFVPAPCTAGRLWINTIGTSTRAVRSVRDVKIQINIETSVGPGYDSLRPYSTMTGCVRIKSTPIITWTEDAEAAGTQSLADIYEATALKHIMFSMSTADGSAMGFYLPNAKCNDRRPVQQAIDGRNQVSVTFEGMSGPTATTELTHSAWRLGFA